MSTLLNFLLPGVVLYFPLWIDYRIGTKHFMERLLQGNIYLFTRACNKKFRNSDVHLKILLLKFTYTAMAITFTLSVSDHLRSFVWLSLKFVFDSFSEERCMSYTQNIKKLTTRC